jgi:hypothetical protein
MKGRFLNPHHSLSNLSKNSAKRNERKNKVNEKNGARSGSFLSLRCTPHPPPCCSSPDTSFHQIMPATGVCDPPSSLSSSSSFFFSLQIYRTTLLCCCSCLPSVRCFLLLCSHRGSGHDRLPPFPAGGAVQQKLTKKLNHRDP